MHGEPETGGDRASVWRLGLLVGIFVIGCGSSSSGSAGEDRLEVKVISAVAGGGTMLGKVRLELDIPGWAYGNAQVSIEGKPATREGSVWWGDVAPERSTVGRHVVHITVSSRSKQGKPIQGAAEASYTVEPAIPKYTLAPVKAPRAIGAVFCSACGADHGARIEVDESLRVSFDLTTSSGNVVSWNGKPTTSSGAPIRLDLALAPTVGGLEPSSLLETGPYRNDSLLLPLEITAPDGGLARGASISRMESTIAVVSQIGRRATDLGVSDPAGRGSMLILTSDGGTPKSFGSAKLVRDVQLFAVYTRAAGYVTDCGAYAGKAGGRGTYEIIASTLVVDVYDRVANKRVGTKQFPPPRVPCPSVILPGETGMSASGDAAAAEAFAISLRPR